MQRVLVVSVISTCLCVSSLWGGYTVDHSLSDFSFYQDHGYDRITAPRCVLTGNAGAPELPVACLNYIIPANVHVESLTITHVDMMRIPGNYLLYPAQPAGLPGESIPWVEPDTLIYNSDDLYPVISVQVIDEGFCDGARIVAIQVHPLLYRPKSRRVFIINTITFEWVVTGSTPSPLMPQVRGKYEQAVYDEMIRATVENDYEVPTYYRRPMVVAENQVGMQGGRPVPVAPGVIITNPSFFNAFQPYADWLTDQGIRTVLISSEYIYMLFSGRDHAEQIRNYITYCWQQGGTYFILGGDDYTVPVRYGNPRNAEGGYEPEENDSIPCDHYFSDLTGNWQVDNDDYWGEFSHDSAECYADVFVGRVSVLNSDEVSTWVSKALHYEQTPGVVFDNVLWINDVGYYNEAAHLRFPSYYTQHDADQYYADDALDAIDHGYAYVNLNCHGNIGDFTPWKISSTERATIYSWWPDSASDYRAGLNWLTNEGKYFFVYAISCHTGAFDRHAHAQYYPYGSDTCIADAFVDNYLYNAYDSLGPFGACAGVFQTRSPEGGMYSNLQDSYYEALFHCPEPQQSGRAYLGTALAMSKILRAARWYVQWAYRHSFYCQNLFGSPVTEAWTKTPGTMSVTHPTRISTGSQNFTVVVRDGVTGLSDAKVCLHKSDDVYEVNSTNELGSVTFLINPQTAGTLKVTVTRPHNIELDYDQYLPSQTICRVLYSPGGEQGWDESDLLPSKLSITDMPVILPRDKDLRFTCAIPRQGDVSVSLHDLTGARIYARIYEQVIPGYLHAFIDTHGLSSGIYFILLTCDQEQVSKKIILIQ
jgi:hypothetical protein